MSDDREVDEILTGGEVPATPDDRPLHLGDPINDTTTLYIVAAGPGVGEIGTQAALSAVAGRTLLREDTDYDPEQYPALAAFLKPFYGERHVPKLSTPEWL